MPTTYGFSSYAEIWDSVCSELEEDDRITALSLDRPKLWILEACQKITQRLPVSRNRGLLLIKDQEDFRFADSTEPATGTGTADAADLAVTGVTATGTGTISTTNSAADKGLKVTGVGTAFKTELAIGEAIIVGTEIKEITAINSDTELYVDTAFDSSLAASAFDYSTTMFTREIIEGSILVLNGETRIVDTVTDPYNLTVTVPFAADASGASFTIDTVVTEIPTEYSEIYKIDRLESAQYCEVFVWSLEDLLMRRRADGQLVAYSNLDIPFCAAVWRDGTGQYLKVYKAADNHKKVTIYSWIRVKPSLHLADAFTDNIPLQEDYDAVIREYVKSRVAGAILKDQDRAKEFHKMFYDMLDLELKSITPTRRMKVDTN